MLFIRKLKEILDSHQDCKGKYELVPLSGEKNQIADVLVQKLNDANLQVEEGAEAAWVNLSVNLTEKNH